MPAMMPGMMRNGMAFGLRKITASEMKNADRNSATKTHARGATCRFRRHTS